MIKIGNIISNTKLVNHTLVDYINYYDNLTILNDLNSNIPTLCVGWGDFKVLELKGVYGNGECVKTILNKRVIPNVLYWEFSFDEDKSQHVSGVDMFVNDVPFYYFTYRYAYINYDPIFFSIQTLEDLYTLLPTNPLNKKLLKNYGDTGNADCIYNFKNEMLYILKNNQISGIDLKMYGYFDFEIENIINTVTSKSNKYIFDEDGSIYQKYYKIFPFFDQLKRFLVVLVEKE